MGFVRTYLCSLASRLPLFTLKERKKGASGYSARFSGCHSHDRDCSELGKCKLLHRPLHLQYKSKVPLLNNFRLED